MGEKRLHFGRIDGLVSYADQQLPSSGNCLTHAPGASRFNFDIEPLIAPQTAPKTSQSRPRLPFDSPLLD